MYPCIASSVVSRRLHYRRNKQLGGYNSSVRSFPPGYQTVAGIFVSRRSRVQTDRTDKWLYQSIRSDKDFAIDRRFLSPLNPAHPLPPPHDVRSAAINGQPSTPRTIINHEIPETLGPLIGDFVFPRAVENCFRRFGSRIVSRKTQCIRLESRFMTYSK